MGNAVITPIDLSDWNRSHLFQSYQGGDFPYINIGCDLDVTRLYSFVKENQLSFYFSMVYLMVKAADQIENYRYRFQDGQPLLIDHNTAFVTHIAKGDEVFKMVECDNYDDMITYAQKNHAKGELPLPESGLKQMSGRIDILNITSIPWISYNHFVRTIKVNGEDNIPKLSMGRFKKESGKVLLPFSSQTHHGLMDGYHVGQYFNLLESYLQEEIWKNE